MRVPRPVSAMMRVFGPTEGGFLPLPAGETLASQIVRSEDFGRLQSLRRLGQWAALSGMGLVGLGTYASFEGTMVENKPDMGSSTVAEFGEYAYDFVSRIGIPGAIVTLGALVVWEGVKEVYIGANRRIEEIRTTNT